MSDSLSGLVFHSLLSSAPDRVSNEEHISFSSGPVVPSREPPSALLINEWLGSGLKDQV